MSTKSRKILFIALVVILAAAAMTTPVFAAEEAEYASPYFATWLSLLPPVIAIALALLTKEVYSSLFIGIVCGGLLYANFNPEMTLTAIVNQFISSLGDGWNVGILIFLVILGAFVSIMNKAGGSAAYGRWAGEHIKGRKGAMLSTFGLGVLIFIDDYFNCLTVGSVMTPVTDKFKISRAKLAYIIDATAAPVCIIAPISSWAAAVSSTVEGTDGLTLFVRTIPYNLYAMLTLAMIIMITAMDFDFGKMKKHEFIAQKTGNLFGGGENEYALAADNADNKQKGHVIDLVLPVIMLIVCCVFGMVYTGGFFDGTSFIDAFANSDASVGLVLGSVSALLLMALLYLPRRVISFKGFSEGIPAGFRQMVPAILILSFAWTLAGFCRDGLGAGNFVGGIVSDNAGASAFLPVLMFLIALGLAFATGTSWGTFGILIPIAVAIFPGELSEILVITISACLAGAVCGDHISPISDTTIMSSSGAQCNHINHVETQIPYAMVVAGVCVVGYIVAGFVQNPWVPLVIGLVALFGALVVLRVISSRQPEPELDGADITFVKAPEKSEIPKR